MTLQNRCMITLGKFQCISWLRHEWRSEAITWRSVSLFHQTVLIRYYTKRAKLSNQGTEGLKFQGIRIETKHKNINLTLERSRDLNPPWTKFWWKFFSNKHLQYYHLRMLMITVDKKSQELTDNKRTAQVGQNWPSGGSDVKTFIPTECTTMDNPRERVVSPGRTLLMSKIRRCRIVGARAWRSWPERSGDILIQQRPLVISRDCALAKQTLRGESRTLAARCVSRDAGSLVSVGKPAGRSLPREWQLRCTGYTRAHRGTQSHRSITVWVGRDDRGGGGRGTKG